jgi:hypothetical protein
MDKTIKILGYGFIIWLVPLITSLLIYPIKLYLNPLFESIMPVIITLTVVIFSVAYFRGVNENFFKEGVVIGLVFVKHNNRSYTFYSCKSHADELRKLYDGYRHYIFNYPSSNNWIWIYNQ